MSVHDYARLVTEKLRDTADKVDPAAQADAIQEALKAYSRVRPREVVQTLTGTGTVFTFALATDYEPGLSTIRAIEYPVDKQDPEYLEADDYRLYRDPTTSVLKLRLVRLKLKTAEKAYVLYTAPHKLDATNDTASVFDREAVASLATALCLRQLAAYYAQSSAPTLGADAVDYRAKSSEYRALADDLDMAFNRHLGIPEGDRVYAASAVQQLDIDVDAERDLPRFFHRGLFR